MSLTTFLLAATVLALTPGPGLVYVVARTVAAGRAEGLASSLGTALGGLVHVLASAFGLSLIIAQSALAFSIVKYVGAAYLIYLGLRLLRQKASAAAPVSRGSRGVVRAFAEGIVVETLNVKTALFFLAFLPQFVDATRPLAPQLALLGSISVLLNTLADVLAVLLAARLLDARVTRSAGARWLPRVSGGLMLALGAWFALAKRQA